jgi:hypothetical protein
MSGAIYIKDFVLTLNAGRQLVSLPMAILTGHIIVAGLIRLLLLLLRHDNDDIDNKNNGPAVTATASSSSSLPQFRQPYILQRPICYTRL